MPCLPDGSSSISLLILSAGTLRVVMLLHSSMRVVTFRSLTICPGSRLMTCLYVPSCLLNNSSYVSLKFTFFCGSTLTDTENRWESLALETQASAEPCGVEELWWALWRQWTMNKSLHYTDWILRALLELSSQYDCRWHVRGKKKCIYGLVGNLKERDHSKDQNVEGRKILK